MKYLYTFGYRPEEQALCQLEMRMFFGYDNALNYLFSDQLVEPKRSPFIRERLQVQVTATSLEDLLNLLNGYFTGDKFKVICLHRERIGTEEKWSLEKRREVERTIGVQLCGEVDLVQPDILYGVVCINGDWLFGQIQEGEAVWLKHQKRPEEYSTALSTKHARAIVNIAVPTIENVTVIDPCCGVGTVLVEACSMGIQITGRDKNWFVTSGSRKNLAHFGYSCEVVLGSIEEATGHYDTAIIDMPYNVFTHSSENDKQSIIVSARKIANRVVFISSEAIAYQIEQAGFKIIDQCIIPKQKFVRTVFVCE